VDQEATNVNLEATNVNQEATNKELLHIRGPHIEHILLVNDVYLASCRKSFRYTAAVVALRNGLLQL